MYIERIGGNTPGTRTTYISESAVTTIGSGGKDVAKCEKEVALVAKKPGAVTTMETAWRDVIIDSSG